MKNYKILLIAALLFSFTGIAQEDEEPVNLTAINSKKHEIRLDALEGLAVPALDISYEYVLSKYSGLGASINITLDSDDGIDQNFTFTPYFRQYFFNKKDYGARGFFAEGLLQYGTGEESSFLDIADINGNPVTTNEDWSQFGIGFAIGQKWVSRNGFVLEISAGAGRYLGGDDFAPDAFFRGGVSVGYRF